MAGNTFKCHVRPYYLSLTFKQRLQEGGEKVCVRVMLLRAQARPQPMKSRTNAGARRDVNADACTSLGAC